MLKCVVGGYTNTFYAEILTCWLFKTRSLKSEDILKQNDYPRAVKDRDTYIHTIAEKLTGTSIIMKKGGNTAK